MILHKVTPPAVGTMETSSARDATTAVYPAQQKRNPYTRPAGPPSCNPTLKILPNVSKAPFKQAYSTHVRMPSQVTMIVQENPIMLHKPNCL
jgi:hypothetical protein